MSSISLAPASLSFAPSNNETPDKKYRNNVLSIPPTVLEKLQAIIANKDGPTGPRKKAVTILASFSGKPIIGIQESLVSENYAKITATRIKAVIRVFNLRIHEAGFIDRFLKEDIGNLRSEIIDTPKTARGRERTLTPLEKTYLDGVIATANNPVLTKTAKIIVALSHGLINRKIKEQLGISINSSHIARIKKRFLNNLESVQELVNVPSGPQTIREVMNEVESEPVSLEISDRVPSPAILDMGQEEAAVASSPSPVKEEKEVTLQPTNSFNPDDFFSEDF